MFKGDSFMNKETVKQYLVECSLALKKKQLGSSLVYSVCAYHM